MNSNLGENFIEDKKGVFLNKMLNELKQAIRLHLNIHRNNLGDNGSNSISRGISAMKRLENLELDLSKN